jgi:hypothetical protein
MNTATLRNRFPVVVVVALAAVVFLGFARTYYLKFLFETPPLRLIAQVHGALATLWLVLHYTQARLVAAHRVEVHRRLGIFAACVGVLLAVQALSLGIAGVAAGRAPPGRDPLQFLSVPFGTTFMFAAFLVSALLMRRKREWHKRLIFLATLALLVPAAGRFDSLLAPYGVPRRVIAIALTVAFVAWAWMDDWRKRGRVHPAYVYGGLLLAVSVPLRAWVGMQSWWLPFAHWVVD